MAKAARKRRSKKAAKVRRSGTGIADTFIDEGRKPVARIKRESVEGPLEEDPGAGDAWLQEREGEDIQRGGR